MNFLRTGTASKPDMTRMPPHPGEVLREYWGEVARHGAPLGRGYRPVMKDIKKKKGRG